jgi:predicted XRE-type DNA-binding protein
MTNRASNAENYVTYTTTGDALDDLGFSPEELPALKLRADALSCILDEIAAKNYSAKQLEKLLDEYQPQVSNLMRGKIAKLSLEKLLYYCARLGIQITAKFKPESKVKRESQMDEVMKAFGLSSARTPPRLLSPAMGHAMAAKKRITISCMPVRGVAAAYKLKRTSKSSRIAARSK